MKEFTKYKNELEKEIIEKNMSRIKKEKNQRHQIKSQKKQRKEYGL